MRAKPLKRIGIFGVAGFNRGDDAISASLVRGFRSLRPDLMFIVPCISQRAAYAETGVEIFTLNRRSAWGIARLFYNIWRADVIVLGGGSLIQDQLGGSRLRGVLGYTWMVTAFSKFLGRKLITAPLGVDQLNTEKGRQAGIESLRRFGVITVRDKISAEVAVALAGPEINGRLQVVCDPVFGYEVAAASDATLPAQSYYVLSPAFEGKNEPRIVEVFSSAIRELAARDAGSSFVIIAMDERAKEDHGKIALIKESLSKALQSRITLYTPTNADNAAHMLRNSRGVIAMRLHALILAFSFVPVFCLSRTTKTEGLMADYDIPGIRLQEGDSCSGIAKAAADAMEGADITTHRQHSDRLKKSLNDYYRQALAYFEA